MNPPEIVREAAPQPAASLFRIAVMFVLLAGAVTVTFGSLININTYRDAGTPDSATVVRVREFVQTGRFYPDMNRPPYMITVYGPLLYVVLGAAAQVGAKLGGDVNVWMRLPVYASFLGCVILVFGIARRVYGSSQIAWLSALFAASSEAMFAWTAQLRSDFMGSCCSLLGLYILLSADTPAGLAAAAACAGIALLFKQTFVAVGVAVFLWLLWRRRFGSAVLFGAVATLTALAGYGFVVWREPQLLVHWAALSHPIYTHRGLREIVGAVLPEPTVLFGVLGAFLAMRQNGSDKKLLIVYAAVAWIIAILTIPQVGSNVNYFWEPLFASAILAGSALPALQSDLRRATGFVMVAAVVLVVWTLTPALQNDALSLYSSIRAFHQRPIRQARWERFLSLFSGHRLLSTQAEVSLQSSVIEVPEPFLNSMLAYRGKWSFDPIVAEIESRQFDYIVAGAGTMKQLPAYRGFAIWNEKMRTAVLREYQLGCVFEDLEVWVRSGNPPPAGSANGFCLATP